MSFPKTLRLVAWSPTLNGEANRLELELEAFKETKRRGTPSWRGRILLEVDRGFVRQVALAIEQMQKRDRERLSREWERLTLEVAPVQIKQQPKDPT